MTCWNPIRGRVIKTDNMTRLDIHVEWLSRNSIRGDGSVNIVIFGANGPTGRLLTKQALDEGHVVTAFTRNAKDFPLRNDRLLVMQGDVFDFSSAEQAVNGQDAVLSTLGV